MAEITLYAQGSTELFHCSRKFFVREGAKDFEISVSR